MNIKTFFFISVFVISAFTSIETASVKEQCPTRCLEDADCCQTGGCYNGNCVECRTPGMVCQEDHQCCDNGGCYLRTCVSCRGIGVQCQADHQCCSDYCDPEENRCSICFLCPG